MRLITAIDLQTWAGTLASRSQFPFLLELLVRATTRKQQRCSFPAFENTDMSGWDGEVNVKFTELEEFVPIVPTLWELSTEGNISKKADKDYLARRENPLGYDPSKYIYVCATLRRWKGKRAWEMKRQKEKFWQDVKVCDAVDLESWINQYPRIGYWIATQLFKNVPENIEPFENRYDEIKLNRGKDNEEKLKRLFHLRVRESELILEYLYGMNKPLYILNSTKKSVLEFLGYILDNSEDEIKLKFNSQAILVNDERTFALITDTKQNQQILIPMYKTDERPELLQRAVNKGHIVLVPVVELPELKDASIIDISLREEYDVCPDKLENNIQNQNSLFSLPKQSAVQLIDQVMDITKKQLVPTSTVIPALFIGKWNEKNENDRLIIEAMSGKKYVDYIHQLKGEIIAEGVPIRKIGNDWLVENPLELMKRFASEIRKEDLLKFKMCFRAVVGERNPALDLLVSDRHVSSLYGKNYKFTDRIKEGICQSLVFIALYGEEYGVAVPGSHQGWVNNVISKLLVEPEFDIWASLGKTTMLLAEASPEIFLDSIESLIFSIDFQQELKGLFVEVRTGGYSVTSHRVEILWALEQIAWMPEYTARVCHILIQLPDYGISVDRLINRSANSLANIFSCSNPQTYASLDKRIELLGILSLRYPDKLWSLLLLILSKTKSVSMQNSKMNWRYHRFSYHIPTTEENYIMMDKVIDLLIQFNYKSIENIIQLIDISYELPAYRKKILEHLNDILSSIDDPEQVVWNHLRMFLSRHRTYFDTDWALKEDELSDYQHLFNMLTNSSDEWQLLWLFNDFHPRLSEGNLRRNNQLDRTERIRIERIHAIHNLLPIKNIDKLISIIDRVKFPEIIGEILATQPDWNTNTSIVDLLSKLLDAPISEKNLKTAAAFYSIIHRDNSYNIEQLKEIFKGVRTKIPNEQISLLLARTTIGSLSLWEYIASLGENSIKIYWDNCSIYNLHNDSSEGIMYVVKQLFDHKRYSSLIEFANNNKDKLSTSEITKILKGVYSTDSSEAIDISMIDYYIGELFGELYSRNDVVISDVIEAEWVCLPLILNYGVQNHIRFIQSELLTNPEFFVQILEWVFKPEGVDEDTDAELQNLSEEQITNRSQRGYILLNRLRDIPGVDATGKIDFSVLLKWVNDVRGLSVERSRIRSCDSCLGELFARFTGFECSPKDEVAQLIDTVNAEILNDGFRRGIINERGPVWRGHGGEQERELVDKYNEFSRQFRSSYPVTSSILLDIANSYSDEAKWHDDRQELRNLEG